MDFWIIFGLRPIFKKCSAYLKGQRTLWSCSGSVHPQTDPRLRLLCCSLHTENGASVPKHASCECLLPAAPNHNQQKCQGGPEWLTRPSGSVAPVGEAATSHTEHGRRLFVRLWHRAKGLPKIVAPSIAPPRPALTNKDNVVCVTVELLRASVGRTTPRAVDDARMRCRDL